MDHETFREMLARRAELLPHEEAAVRAHLTDCLECRKRAVAYARQTALLRSLPEADPPPALRAGVMDAIQRRPMPSAIPIWRRPMALVPVAAALLVAGIGFGALRPASSGHSTAFGVATTTRVTSTMGPQATRAKLKTSSTSPGPSSRGTSRSLLHATPHVPPSLRPGATPAHVVPVSSVAENPPGVISQPPATRPASTSTPLPSALHVAAGAPPTSGREAGVQSGAADNAKGSPPGYGPVAEGTAPSHPPRHTSPRDPAAPSHSPVPTPLPIPAPAPAARTPTPPVPTPTPYATAPVVRAVAPVRPTATVTGTPTATTPPTPTPLSLPYGGPLVTPTPTP